MDSNFQFLVARLSTVMGDGPAVPRSERICCGTEGSNPSPSSGESTANLTSGGESYRWPSGFQDKLKGLAAAENCTPAQLALAWVLSRARHIVPIPGTSHRHRLMLPPLNEATRYRFSEELLPLRG